MPDLKFDLSRPVLVLTRDPSARLVWLCNADLFPEEDCETHFLAAISASRLSRLYSQGHGLDEDLRPIEGLFGLPALAPRWKQMLAIAATVAAARGGGSGVSGASHPHGVPTTTGSSSVFRPHGLGGPETVSVLDVQQAVDAPMKGIEARLLSTPPLQVHDSPNWYRKNYLDRLPALTSLNEAIASALSGSPELLRELRGLERAAVARIRPAALYAASASPIRATAAIRAQLKTNYQEQIKVLVLWRDAHDRGLAPAELRELLVLLRTRIQMLSSQAFERGAPTGSPASIGGRHGFEEGYSGNGSYGGNDGGNDGGYDGGYTALDAFLSSNWVWPALVGGAVAGAALVTGEDLPEMVEGAIEGATRQVKEAIRRAALVARGDGLPSPQAKMTNPIQHDCEYKFSYDDKCAGQDDVVTLDKVTSELDPVCVMGKCYGGSIEHAGSLLKAIREKPGRAPHTGSTDLPWLTEDNMRARFRNRPTVV
jgi:hypothetical protein